MRNDAFSNNVLKINRDHVLQRLIACYSYILLPSKEHMNSYKL